MLSLIVQGARRPEGCIMNNRKFTSRVDGSNKVKQKNCIKLQKARNSVDGDDIGYNVWCELIDLYIQQ